MYPGHHAVKNQSKAAFIMAASGESVSYGELELRSNRLAHLLRAQGLKRLDHFSVYMENNSRYIETCVAGERTGLYYTCINSYLTAQEVAYIVNNSESQIMITSASKLAVIREALEHCPRVKLCLVVHAGDTLPTPGTAGAVVWQDFAQAVAGFPSTPVSDESLGTAMLYSSGTTGRPKGVLRPLAEQAPSEILPLFAFLGKLWRCEESMVYLSPAPLYHSAPLANVSMVIRSGGTAVIMEHFDPKQYLMLVERFGITHSQLVPTMFSRMLKLPEADRLQYDLSTLQVAIHAAAPCPAQVKEQMIAWWGPIIHEYYGATEGLGFAACDTAEWQAHRGTVGRILFGQLHILDDAMQEVPKGQAGEVWFKTGSAFEYFNDPARTAESRSADGTMSTVGDVGYVDEDGFLYLTDRSSFMIISGGVNIYPQECENLLVTHPKVADAAVFGIPNEDFGEEVKAVIEPLPGIKASPELAQELIAFCAQHLAPMKCPRSIDFTEQLPRLPTGKLYKRVLRDAYWVGHKTRIV